MIVIDKMSRVPVYEQIKTQIMTLINLGIYPAGSKLPSIRAVSSETGVNVNTVKKAFSDLETSGVIYTVPGTGSFVSDGALGDTAIRKKALGDAGLAIETAKAIGVEKQELIDIINTIYKEG